MAACIPSSLRHNQMLYSSGSRVELWRYLASHNINYVATQCRIGTRNSNPSPFEVNHLAASATLIPYLDSSQERSFYVSRSYHRDQLHVREELRRCSAARYPTSNNHVTKREECVDQGTTSSSRRRSDHGIQGHNEDHVCSRVTGGAAGERSHGIL